MPPNF